MSTNGHSLGHLSTKILAYLPGEGLLREEAGDQIHVHELERFLGFTEPTRRGLSPCRVRVTEAHGNFRCCYWAR